MQCVEGGFQDIMSIEQILCEDNPLDLRPAAVAVVQKLKHLRAQPTNDKPPVIIMGEAHNKPTHRLLQQAVMALCTDEGLSVAYHFEQEHSLLPQLLKSRLNMNLSPRDIAALSVADSSGRMLLKTAMLFRPVRFATYSAENVFAFAMDNNIAVAFTDAAKCRDDGAGRVATLNLRDPLTAQFTAAKRGQPVTSDAVISVETPEGMDIRNQMMVAKSVAHAQQVKPDIIVHHCGFQHAVGDARFGFSYAGSLAKQFQGMGHDTVVVCPAAASGDEHIPPDAAEGRGAICVVNGLAANEFTQNDLSEKAFLREIMYQSGGLIAPYEIDDATRKTWLKNLPREYKDTMKLRPV